jgi:CHAD domain-containing protein
MKPDKLVRRWSRRLAQLQKALKRDWAETLRSGDVEAVHRLRVTLRRSRLYLCLGDFILGRDRVRVFRAWSARILDAVGPVRDLDITRAWLGRRNDTARLSGQLTRRRVRLWNSVRKKLGRRMPMPVAVLREMELNAKQRLRVEERRRRFMLAARREVENFKAHLEGCDAEQWHSFRQGVRRLRYWCEVAVPRKKQARDLLIHRLIDLQENLGEAQNLNAAEQILFEPGRLVLPPGLHQALKTERHDWLAKGEKALRELKRCRSWKALSRTGS